MTSFEIMGTNEEIVSTVYKWVIGDVIEKMSLEFAHLGVDESILVELQQSWEQKLIASKVVDYPENFDFYNSSPQGGASMLGSNQGLGGMQNTNIYQGGNAFQGSDMYDYGQLDARLTYGQMGFNPQSVSTNVPRNITPNNHDVSSYYNLNQTDGASDENLTKTKKTHSRKEKLRRKEKEEIELHFDSSSPATSSLISQMRHSATLSQVDGLDDEEDDEDDLEDEDEENIGSDLDDEDSEEDVDTEHIILCQYEKVSRIKNKWKAMLRDGVMTINGKDYLFNKANGEFEW